MNTESIKASMAEIRARLERLAATYSVPVNHGAIKEYRSSSRFCRSVNHVLSPVGTLEDPLAREAFMLAETCADVATTFWSRHLYLKATGIPKVEFWAKCAEFSAIVRAAAGERENIIREIEPFKSGLPGIGAMEITREWDIFGEIRAQQVA